MKSRAASLTAIVFVLLLVTFVSSSPAAGQPAPDSAAAGETAAPEDETAFTPSLMFIENVGQFAEGARFKVHGAGRAFWLADDALWITIMEPAPPADIRDRFAADVLMQPAEQPETPRRGVNLRITFPGSNPDAELSAYGPVETTISYFLGNDPEKWRPDVPVWAGVQYRDLYPGLDLVWDSGGSASGLRLICRAADRPAALAQVQMRVEGADALALEGDALRVNTAAGEFRLPLLSVTDIAGEPLPLPGAAHAQGNTLLVPFTLHPAASPEAGDPADVSSSLLYSTFLGGSGEDYGVDVALDSAGNTTLIGQVSSDDFPTTPGAFDTTYDHSDVFVSRLNAAGNALLYSTFIGGNNNDRGAALALDAAGNATLTGNTSSVDFPITFGSFDTEHYGNNYPDAFVTRLNAAGNALLYSTFIGGSGLDEGHDLALDAAGNANLTGRTRSADFPITPGVFDDGHNGGDDVFVTRLSAAGSALIYSTFLGASSGEIGCSLALDVAGNVTVTGHTGSVNFPTAGFAYDTSHNGSDDVFVTRLNPAGSALLYSTFLGGYGIDGANSLALDAAGNATIAGHTSSYNFRTTPDAFDTNYNGGDDVFVTSLNAAGSNLLFSTFIGAGGIDWANSLALDAAGNATITGYTTSADFPTTPDPFDAGLSGPFDVFVTRLNATGSVLFYSTFLGGSGGEAGRGIALNVAGKVVVTGATDSTDFPVTPGAFDGGYSGGDGDAFIARFVLPSGGPAAYLPIVIGQH